MDCISSRDLRCCTVHCHPSMLAWPELFLPETRHSMRRSLQSPVQSRGDVFRTLRVEQVMEGSDENLLRDAAAAGGGLFCPNQEGCNAQARFRLGLMGDDMFRRRGRKGRRRKGRRRNGSRGRQRRRSLQPVSLRFPFEGHTSLHNPT